MATKRRTDGDGSVHQMHVKGCEKPTNARGKSTCGCKWRGAIVVGWKPTDKKNSRGDTIMRPVRRTVTATTESGCAERVRQLRAEVDAKTLPSRETPTLEQWLNHCHSSLLPRQKKVLKERTLTEYRRVFDQLLIPLMGHIRLDRLTSDHIEDAWQALSEVGNPSLGDDAKPLSATSIHHAHTILARMLRLATQRKKITVNPAGPDSMDAPPKNDTEVDPIPAEEWRKILDAAKGGLNVPRWSLAIQWGLRQGEALGLRWSDLDLETGDLRIRQTLYRTPRRGLEFGTPKTDQSKRTFRLPAELVAELKAHRKEQAAQRLHAGDQWRGEFDLVFATGLGGPIDPSVDRKRWEALLKKAGVPYYKLHTARHTAATEMLLDGVDSRVVMEIMGWSQITTAAKYQHAVSAAKQDVASRVGAKFYR